MEIILGFLVVSIFALIASLTVHRFIKNIISATIISILLTPIIIHCINRILEGYSIDYPGPIEFFALFIATIYSIIPCIAVAIFVKKKRSVEN